jgi:hypothetical protein
LDFLGFDQYFQQLHPDNNTWLNEYWNELDCAQFTRTMTIGSCLAARKLPFKQESYVPFVVDAVTVVANALHEYLRVCMIIS